MHTCVSIIHFHAYILPSFFASCQILAHHSHVSLIENLLQESTRITATNAITLIHIEYTQDIHKVTKAQQWKNMRESQQRNDSHDMCATRNCREVCALVAKLNNEPPDGTAGTVCCLWILSYKVVYTPTYNAQFLNVSFRVLVLLCDFYNF